MNLWQQMAQIIHQTDFGGETRAYLALCITPIILSLLIGVVLGVLSSRWSWLAFASANISGLARAVPTVAFIAATYTFLGFGYKPSVISLTILGIPPILLNTIAGLRGLDPAVVDAARGMGMSPLQQIARVQIPLVLPVIAAGARTSAVQIVATAPLMAYFGAGGYGDYILAGISLINNAEVLVGGIPVVGLALLAEFGLSLLQNRLTPVALRTNFSGVLPNDEEDMAPTIGKGVIAA